MEKVKAILKTIKRAVTDVQNMLTTIDSVLDNAELKLLELKLELEKDE